MGSLPSVAKESTMALEERDPTQKRPDHDRDLDFVQQARWSGVGVSESLMTLNSAQSPQGPPPAVRVIFVAAFLLMFTLTLILMGAPPSDASPRPQTGEVLFRADEPGWLTQRMKISLPALRDRDTVVTLIDKHSGRLALASFVRAGERVVLEVRPGSYLIQFITGDRWIDRESWFGADAIEEIAGELELAEPEEEVPEDVSPSQLVVPGDRLMIV